MDCGAAPLSICPLFRQDNLIPVQLLDNTALDENKLPTHRDVLKICFLEQIKKTESRKEPK